MFNLEKLVRKLICARAVELYNRYLNEGKVLYAEAIKESLPECFER